MHNGVLKVEHQHECQVLEFFSTIEKDVKFLQGLDIMDYSLFLIIIQVPQDREASEIFEVGPNGQL